MNATNLLPVPRAHASSLAPLPESVRSIHASSTLQDLPLTATTFDLTQTGQDLAQGFQNDPTLPGVLLVKQFPLPTRSPKTRKKSTTTPTDSQTDSQFVGLLARSRFLEFFLHPDATELFLSQSLQVIQSYLHTPILTLAANTPILVAAQQALRRSPEQLGEPILVEYGPNQYKILDFHVLNIAYWQIRGIETQISYERSQIQMIRQDKMASLGRLVDGVAHEILDPVSFIWGNLSHMSHYGQDLMKLIDRYELELPEPSPALLALREDIEIDYLRHDIPKTLDSIKSGADRLTKLATGLQNFCHIDEVYPKSADMHDCLDHVLLLLKSRIKSDIPIVKRYGHLPAVPCFIGQITQVFLNLSSYLIDHLLVQAISDRVLQDFPLPHHKLDFQINQPSLTLVTETCSIDGSSGRWISIRIGRNGDALPQAVQQTILDSFHADNPFEQETSLVTTYRIITHRHKGVLKLRTAANPHDHLEPGISTEFEVLIPLT